jgi:hypothetical protein
VIGGARDPKLPLDATTPETGLDRRDFLHGAMATALGLAVGARTGHAQPSPKDAVMA